MIARRASGRSGGSGTASADEHRNLQMTTIVSRRRGREHQGRSAPSRIVDGFRWCLGLCSSVHAMSELSSTIVRVVFVDGVRVDEIPGDVQAGVHAALVRAVVVAGCSAVLLGFAWRSASRVGRWIAAVFLLADAWVLVDAGVRLLA